jgi:hypothetical protein
MKYFKEHPEMKDKAIFYCDSDVLFTDNLDIEKFVDDEDIEDQENEPVAESTATNMNGSIAQGQIDGTLATRKSPRLQEKTANIGTTGFGRFGVLMEENDEMSEKENDQYDDYWTEDMLNKELENDNDKVRAIYGIKSKDKALVTKRSQPNSKEVESMKAIEKELGQMLCKKVWHPVYMHQLTSDEKKRIIRSSLFLKEKYDASGKFEKIKARLVAGGHMQDRSIYPDLSAPTAAISSVFAVAAIAALENRGVCYSIIYSIILKKLSKFLEHLTQGRD